MISFMTKAFGRGTDFKVYDQEIKDGGGIHILQLFMSEEESEEIQIKGRTARFGSHGSYS